MKKFALLPIIILLGSLLLISCDKGESANILPVVTTTPTPIIPTYNNQADEEEEGPSELAVWQAYWNNKDINKEISILKDSINNIIHFAAYFNEENELFIPKEIMGLHKTEEIDLKEDYNHYLSFVNDKVLSDGKSSLKDTKLLYELFQDDKSIENHINSICTLALENGYDGIEIDYEAIKKDMDLWKLYLEFISKLYDKTKSNNLSMRVVLEPSAPIETLKSGELKFPKGPEYVMMCYNLYGFDSERGPKADKEFILSLVNKMKLLQVDMNFAFATGGFDWDENNKIISLTESQALKLQRTFQANAVRDEKSAALTFSYTDNEGKKHTVWYADGTTLKEWIETAKTEGISKFSLWRLNGNESKSLNILND